MPTLLTQLATLFDAQGWRYRLHPEQDRLSTGFQTPRGDVSLDIYAPAEETLVFEALCLATLDPAHTEVLATLDQYLPEHLTLTRQPDDGEVCLRLLVPVPGASLTAEALDAPLDLLLEIAPVLRAALLLVQQGIPLEEALQRAQAEPAPEAVETSSAMPEALQALLQELVELQEHNDRSSLERKRALCQTILAQVQRQDASELWAAIQEELGNTCQRLYDMTGAQTHAQAAAEAYQAALTVYTRDALPTDWAMTQNNLATLYKSRYDRSGEERWATLAAEAYQAALAILTPTVAPAMALRIGRSLAGLYSRLRRWDEAHAVYTIALKAADNQYLAAPGENERRRVMADYTELCSADASCLLHLQQPARAWIRLESGRARALGESLGLEALAALHHGATAVDELRTRRRAVQQADQALHRAEARFLVASNPAEQQAATTEHSQVRRTLETAYTALRESIARLGLPEPTALDAAALVGLPVLPHTAVVTLLLTPETCQALILHAGTVWPVALPAAFTLAEMHRLVHALPPEVEGWIDTYNARGQTRRALTQVQADAQADLQAARRAVEEAETAWRAALETMAVQGGTSQVGWYFAYRLAYEVVRGERHPQAERALLDAWKQTVADTHTFLVTHLWQPLAAALPADVTQVVFVPTGPTALLPVHAAAPDHLTVAYAPSLSVWRQCVARITSPTAAVTSNLFLATPANDLFFTQAEAEWLHDRVTALGHPITWLPQQHATSAAVAAQARGHSLVHFAGHAGYRWQAPLDSALICADAPLTLTAIRQEMDLRLARLITLSACSTGMSDVFTSGEEFVGLPAALLETGAPAVVASLWPVHDVSTAFLMDRFYEALWV